MQAPGFGPPPSSMQAPGMAPPPSMQQTQQQNSGAFGQNFRPPANMPENFNFSAPVIRLGMSGPQNPETPTSAGAERKGANADPVSNRRGMGLGYDSRDQQRNREPQLTYAQPTREEVMRSIYVGRITDAYGGDENVEKILNCAGGLRKWIRMLGANLDPKHCGIAEYDTADSLAVAIEVLKDVQVPSKDQSKEGTAKAKSELQENGVKKELKSEDGDAEMNNDVDDNNEASGTGNQDSGPKMDKLVVNVDQKSIDYIEQWRARGSLGSPEDLQFRIDSAREDLRQILASIANPAPARDEDGDHKMNGDSAVQPQTETRTDAVTGEVVTIPLTVEDELSEIPAEMREQVSKEIAAFRDRANKKDMERLEREEKIEAQERARNARSGLSSTTNGNANAIPVGPRAQQAMPTAPKGMTGAQIPRDYQGGVNFAKGGATDMVRGLRLEDEESDNSDTELERRRIAKRKAEQEKAFLDQERRWLNRERHRAAAIERERGHEAAESVQREQRREAMRKRLAEWDDDIEAERQVEEYYVDRSLWVRNRAIFRAEEARLDAMDRSAEERRHKVEQDRRDKASGAADEFLAQQAAEMESRLPSEPPRGQQQSVKINLGSALAAKKTEQAAGQQRRNMAAVEGLLDEEDEPNKAARRELIPIAEDASRNSGMSHEERAKAARQLAQEIPSDRRGLWNWDVKWEFVDGGVMSDLRRFTEKKVVDYLGIQEQALVEDVQGVVANRGRPAELVDLLMKVCFPYFFFVFFSFGVVWCLA